MRSLAALPIPRYWQSWPGVAFARRSKALREALEGRFSAHHGLMVGRMLAHIDYLDESIAELSIEIERVIAPFSEEVKLLDTIPGVDRRTAEVLIALRLGRTWTNFPPIVI